MLWARTSPWPISPQAEPEIEPSWQHGEVMGRYELDVPEPVAEIEDAEPEMEL